MKSLKPLILQCVGQLSLQQNEWQKQDRLSVSTLNTISVITGLKQKQKQSVRIHTLGGQIHSLDINSVLEIYSLKSAVRGDITH